MNLPQHLRHFTARFLTLWLLASPTGLVGAAIQPHLRESTGNTTVIGGAIAAGESLQLKIGGDLALLAAQSSTSRQINDYNQGAKKATTLKLDEQELRQLLSTITVGSGSGNSAGPLNLTADGMLLADRMTTAGVVKGYSHFNHEWLPMNTFTNVGTMIPAAVISIPASLNNPLDNWQLEPKKEDRK